MADNSTYNELVGFTTGTPSGIVDNPRNIGVVMNNLAIRVTREVTEQINNENLIDTGNLIQSIEMPVKIFGTSFVATLFMADYYDFINQGVTGAIDKSISSDYSFKKGGKKPPVNISNVDGRSLRQWAERKGLNPFAVRESIFQKGIRPRPFWDKSFKEITTGKIFKQLEKDLRTAGVNATTEGIRNLFKKN